MDRKVWEREGKMCSKGARAGIKPGSLRSGLGLSGPLGRPLVPTRGRAGVCLTKARAEERRGEARALQNNADTLETEVFNSKETVRPIN